MNYTVMAGAGVLVLVLIVAMTLGLATGDPDKVGQNPMALQQESDKLDASIAESKVRMVAGENIVTKLVEGRAPLGEVAQEFLDLHADDPGFTNSYLLHYPNESLLERATRDMANRAHVRVTDPLKREQLDRRLTEQFQTLYPNTRPLEFDPVPEVEPVPLTPKGGRRLPRPGAAGPGSLTKATAE
jgi:hypothetical protein